MGTQRTKGEGARPWYAAVMLEGAFGFLFMPEHAGP